MLLHKVSVKALKASLGNQYKVDQNKKLKRASQCKQ